MMLYWMKEIIAYFFIIYLFLDVVIFWENNMITGLFSTEKSKFPHNTY
jgi:hypothetical protein